MLTGVMQWFKDAINGKDVDVIKKSELLLGMENLSTTLKENIFPTIEKMEVYVKDGTIDEKTLMKVLKLVHFKARNKEDFISSMKEYATRLSVGVEDAKTLIDEFMPNVLVTDNITIRQSAILTLASQLDGAIGYLSDLMTFIVYELNGEKNVIYPNFTKRVLGGGSNFDTIMKSLSVGKGIYGRIADLSDVQINVDKTVLREVASDYDLSFSLPSNSFNGNPFYFLGKWWVDFELKRAARYRDMKRITEYKLIQLKEKQERGDVSTTIDKQIEYYEERVKKYDAKIRKLEE